MHFAAHLIESVPANARRDVELMLSGCRVVALGAGTGIVHNTTAEMSLLYVDDGLVVTQLTASARRRSIISCEAAAGGVVVAPDGDDYVVQALRDSRLVIISAESLERLLAVPALASVIVRGLQQSSRQAQATTKTLAHARQSDRVRVKLLQLARDYGRVSRDGIRLDFPLTHETLAAMVGAARETVTRALDELEREHFLVRDGRVFRLLVDASAIAA
jgi:CRP-like cAMP-binding protein